MERYDPEVAPLAREWLALSELERIDLAEEHHLNAKIQLPNVRAHATFHAIVENQLALEDQPVRAAMSRLIGEGLSRHDAIHAIASVLAEHVNEVFRSPDSSANWTSKYYHDLEGLTARKWREG